MHGAEGLLISAAAGYWVLERADKHKGAMRRIGYLVGTLIVVSSIIGFAYTVSCKTSGWGPYGMMKKNTYCPMVGKAM